MPSVGEEEHLAVTVDVRDPLVDQQLPQLTRHSLQSLEGQTATAQFREHDDKDRLGGIVGPSPATPGSEGDFLLFPDLKLPKAYLSDPGYLGGLE